MFHRQADRHGWPVYAQKYILCRSCVRLNVLIVDFAKLVMFFTIQNRAKKNNPIGLAATIFCPVLRMTENRMSANPRATQK